MLRHRGLHLALLAVVLAGCVVATQRGAAGPMPDPCTAPGADTAGWTRVDAGPFSFTAPPEYQRRKVQGIDSYVGEWTASRRRGVHFDWGMYSSTLKEADTYLQGYRQCMAEIGGRRVQVVIGYDSVGSWSSRGQKYVVAASWRDVHKDTHLTFNATARDRADLPILLSIVQSIRFAERTPCVGWSTTPGCPSPPGAERTR